MPIRILVMTLSCTLLLSLTFLYSRLNAGVYDKEYALHLPSCDISLIVVDNNESRMNGLSGINKLPDDEAMLFVFNEMGDYGIWMKDMNFPIDILWLDDQKRVEHIEEAVSPNTFPKIFYPNGKSLYVLEANANFAKNNNIKVGNFLNFDLK